MADEPTLVPGAPPTDAPADPAPSLPDPSPPPIAPDPPPAPTPSVRDQLVERGLDASGFETDTAAMDALVTAAQQGIQGRQYVELGKRMAPHASEFEAWQKEQQQQVPEPAPPDEPKQEWEWDAPEWDPSWARYVNPDGSLDPNVDPVIGHKIATALNWEQQKARDIVRDPRKVFSGIHGERFGEIDKRFEGLQPGETIDQFLGRRLDEKLAVHDARRETDTYFQEHLKDYYVLNDQGQPLTDPTTGEWATTPKGKAFREHAQQAQNFGLTDENAIRQYAERMVGADEATGRFKQAPGQPPTPTPSAPTRKKSFLEAALHGQQLPAADGTVPAPSDPAPSDRHLSALEIAEDELRRHGDI